MMGFRMATIAAASSTRASRTSGCIARTVTQLRRAGDAGGGDLRGEPARRGLIGKLVLQRRGDGGADDGLRERLGRPEIHAEARRPEERFEAARRQSPEPVAVPF